LLRAAAGRCMAGAWQVHGRCIGRCMAGAGASGLAEGCRWLVQALKLGGDWGGYLARLYNDVEGGGRRRGGRWGGTWGVHKGRLGGGWGWGGEIEWQGPG
jgi:hypothetical protein